MSKSLMNVLGNTFRRYFSAVKMFSMLYGRVFTKIQAFPRCFIVKPKIYVFFIR